MNDVLVPIVFPDYKITVDTPQKNVDLLPWFSFDDFTVPKTRQKISNLGHAGILLINGDSGLTKYYEYGRYDYPDQKGIVRRVPVLDAKTDKSGVIIESLVPIFDKLCRVAGKGSRIEGVYIEASGVFDRLNRQVISQKSMNNNPKRKEYNLTSNSCIHFVKRLVSLAGKDTPWMMDPRPNSYIGEFRDDYRDLDFNPKTKELNVEVK
ncbi:hypothetical protein [Photobacterium nomapromontoriensis]|uniref:hypothetical protein n=1 Tax=Photobacterium nomapromontoriensis TaxID=2910237 RepID=UPI003D0F4D12